MATSPRKSTIVAVVLSFLFAGLGELYLGARKRAIQFLVLGLFLVLLFNFLELGDLYPFLWAYCLVDTYKMGSAMNSEPPKVNPTLLLAILEVIAALFFLGSLLG